MSSDSVARHCRAGCPTRNPDKNPNRVAQCTSTWTCFLCENECSGCFHGGVDEEGGDFCQPCFFHDHPDLCEGEPLVRPKFLYAKDSRQAMWRATKEMPNYMAVAVADVVGLADATGFTPPEGEQLFLVSLIHDRLYALWRHRKDPDTCPHHTTNELRCIACGAIVPRLLGPAGATS